MQTKTIPEQRGKQRDIASFSIKLHGKDGETIHCKALNLSISGMLLEYDGANLAIGFGVDVIVCINKWKTEIPAIVIHSNSSCTGVMFQNPQPDLYRIATKTLQRANMSINSRTPISSATNRR